MPAPNLNPSAYLHGNPDGTTVVAHNASLRCPRHLPKEAKAVWRKIVPPLEAAGLLSEGDIVQLANLCWYQAYAEKLMAQLWEEGPMVRSSWASTGKDGIARVRLIANPIVKMLPAIQVHVNKLTEQFGLTLRSRAAMGDTLRNGNADQPADAAPDPLAMPAPSFPEERLN